MEPATKYNYYLQTNPLEPLEQRSAESLRRAAEHTSQQLTVFVSFLEPAGLVGEHGWVVMQRRVSEIYAITAQQAFRTNVAVDVVLVDFCAYSADDMAAYTEITTLVDTTGNIGDTTEVPVWWPAANITKSAADGSPVSVRRQQIGARIPWLAFPHVALGGTFDHLHIGHKILLTAAALTATQKLTIGVSAEALLVKKKYKDYLEPYRARELGVLLFLRRIRKDIIFELEPLYDIYGPTIVDASVAALVVSQETLNGCEVLNDRRGERGMPPMQILAVDLVSAGGSDKLSSTAIREALAHK